MTAQEETPGMLRSHGLSISRIAYFTVSAGRTEPK